MPRDATMRPTNRTYSFAQHGRSDTGMQGMYYTRPGAASVWKPSYGGLTTIRIFPVRSLEDPSVWDQYRFSADPGEFGDWIRRYPSASMGTPKASFIIGDPADETLDLAASPAWLLYNGVQQAITNHQEQQGWAALLKGGPGRGAVLARPSDTAFVQCALMQHKSKVFQPPKGAGADGELVVMALGRSAANEMLALFEERIPGVDENADWDQLFVAGDPVSLDRGRYVTFYKAAEGDPRQRAAQQYAQPRSAAESFGQRPAQGYAGANEQEEIGYGCYIEDNFQGMGAVLAPVEQLIASKVKPWDQILNFPSFEIQAAWLAERFPPDLICYCWREHPDWIPEHVQRAVLAPRQVAMGGYGGPVEFAPQVPPQGYPQQQPQQQLPQQAPYQPPQQVPGQAPPQHAPQGQPAAWGQQPTQGSLGDQLAQQYGVQQAPYQPSVQQAPFGQPQQQSPQQAPYQQPVQQAPFGQPQQPQQAPYQPPQQAPYQPPVQQAPFGQPQQQPGSPVAGWQGGFQNTVAQPPQGVQDSSLPAGGIPAGLPQQPPQQAPQEFQQPVQPGQYQQPQQQAPPQQNPVATAPPGFTQPPTQPAPARAATALERARQSAGR